MNVLMIFEEKNSFWNLFFFFVGEVSTPPPSDPVKHWSFDTLNGLVLMEGTTQVTALFFIALTQGKVKNLYKYLKIKTLQKRMQGMSFFS